MRDEELLELLGPAHSCPRHRTLEREIDVAVLDIDLADTLDADALRAISPKLPLGQARYSDWQRLRIPPHNLLTPILLQMSNNRVGPWRIS